jgi:hypothetical protein
VRFRESHRQTEVSRNPSWEIIPVGRKAEISVQEDYVLTGPDYDWINPASTSCKRYVGARIIDPIGQVVKIVTGEQQATVPGLWALEIAAQSAVDGRDRATYRYRGEATKFVHL